MSGLVLTRRVGEKIFIGKNVVVKVIAWHGAQIRLQIEAPKNICIDRGEIHERKIKEEGWDPGEVE